MPTMCIYRKKAVPQKCWSNRTYFYPMFFALCAVCLFTGFVYLFFLSSDTDDIYIYICFKRKRKIETMDDQRI